MRGTHVDREARVRGEERLLSFGITPICAVGVPEQLANREAVGGLGRSDFSMNGHR